MKRILRFAAINITTHPHSPEKYFHLFEDLFKLMKPVKVRGSDYLVLGQYSPVVEGSPLEGIWGQFYRYVNIDKSLPALDLSQLKPIVSVDGTATLPIPDHIKPNLRTIDFVFFPRGHRLFYDVNFLSPYSAQKALISLMNCLDLHEVYGDVNVVVEQKTNIIDEILGLDSLTKLSLSFTMPNADDLSHLKDKIAQRFGVKVNATRVKEELTGKRGDGLTPEEDPETSAMMELALSNGEIVAGGFADGKKVEYRSKKYPEVFAETYDPRLTTAQYALRVAAARELNRLIKKG